MASGIAALGLVATLGLRSLAEEARLARARHAEQSAAVARGLASQLVDDAAAIDTSPQALAWTAGLDGARLEPATKVRIAADPVVEALQADLERELSRLEDEGGTALVVERLASIAALAPRPELGAWAQLRRSALHERAGDLDGARVALEALIVAHPTTRDERGLLHSYAARGELLRLQGDPLDGLVRLHADALRARSTLDDTANAALAGRLVARIAAKSPEAAHAARQAAVEAARPLRLRAAWSAGASEWLARGGAGVRLFDLPVDPLAEAPDAASVLVSARRTDDGWSGTALELERVASATLDKAARGGWDELGWVAALHAPDGRLVLGASAAEDDTTALEPLGGMLVGWSLRIHGRATVARAAADQRRFLAVAALTIGALLVAGGAGWATWRALHREQRVVREREQFVAAVTHELKTPLASIRLLAELLERGGLEPQDASDFGGRVVRESDRLAKLVDGILRYARLEHGLDRSQLRPIDAVELMEQAARAMEVVAAERGHAVRVERPSTPLVAFADRDALLGAVSELIDNATKYGDPTGGVDLAARARDGRLRIEVLDRGRGVPEAEREVVFVPFKRLGDELVRERPGVGLGLALVRGVAQAHGGAAGCVPREGGGSCFWLELPLEAA